MDELYDLVEPAESFDDLLPYPETLDEFQETYEMIDVGYDCFCAQAYVCGAFYIVKDEECYRRDTWGWWAHADYYDEEEDRIVYRSVDGHCKCSTPEEALETLLDRIDDLIESRKKKSG